MFRLPVVMMKFRLTRFNIYLVLALAGVWGAGCKTAEERQESSLRLHLEAPSYYNKTNVVAPIGRAHPFQVTVDREPFLFENNITAAKVVEERGGFEIELQFDQKGTWLLEQYTTANKTRRVAVFAIFGESRWLAAPLITRRVSDGKFTFSPDATREEADRIVRGLNRVAWLFEHGRR